jgi:hypothetical protein
MQHHSSRFEKVVIASPVAGQYVTLHIKNWMKKSQNMLVSARQNGCGPAFLHSLFVEVGKRHRKA